MTDDNDFIKAEKEFRHKVFCAAVKWWSSIAPSAMTIDAHLARPTVNAKTPAERELALAVARYITAEDRLMEDEHKQFAGWWDSELYADDGALVGKIISPLCFFEEWSWEFAGGKFPRHWPKVSSAGLSTEDLKCIVEQMLCEYEEEP